MSDAVVAITALPASVGLSVAMGWALLRALLWIMHARAREDTWLVLEDGVETARSVNSAGF